MPHSLTHCAVEFTGTTPKTKNRKTLHLMERSRSYAGMSARLTAAGTH
jgi:hypothetical protein